MKKFKRLNNKGFTLIELLAVIVILAVVMGIATTAVLSSMNKARGGSLIDSAKIVANGFYQRYMESQVDSTAGETYTGYAFPSSKAFQLTSDVLSEFKLSDDNYEVAGSITEITTNSAVTTSFVAFDESTSTFVVCLAAKPNGSVYVANFKQKTGETTTLVEVPKTITAGDAMIGCSNGKQTW